MQFESGWSEGGEAPKKKKFIPIEEVPDPATTEEGLRLQDIQEISELDSESSIDEERHSYAYGNGFDKTPTYDMDPGETLYDRQIADAANYASSATRNGRIPYEDRHREAGAESSKASVEDGTLSRQP